jgi:uncharacterized protein involved in outer membrane biogenesis
MKLSRRVRRWLIVITVLIGLFAIVGFFVLPPIVRAQAEKQLSAKLGREVHVGKVRLNPFALSVTIEDLDVALKEGHGSFVGWKRLYVDFDALSSVMGSWVLGAVELEGFHGQVVLYRDGTFNFADLLAKFPATSPATPAKPSRPLRVVRLLVKDAQVSFRDQSRRQEYNTSIGPLTFNLKEFRTAGATGAPYRFEAVSEAGEKFAWSGTLSMDPIGSKGRFEVGNLSLKKHTPYFEERISADVTGGTVSVAGKYELQLSGAAPQLRIADTEVHVRDLRVVERAGAKPALELPSLDVDGIQADATTLKVSVAHFAAAGGHVSVRRNENGTINLLTMLQPDSPATAVAHTANPSAKPAFQPDVSVGEIAVKDFSVDVLDRTLAQPAALSLAGIQFLMKDFSLAGAAAMPLDLSFRWNPQGEVRAAGTVKLNPELSANLTTEVSKFGILPLSPYLEQFVNARITQGSFSSRNEVHFSMVAGVPSVDFSGEIEIDRFGLVDSAHDQDLAGFASVGVSGIKASTAPKLSVSVAEIKVDGPYARALISADKSINLVGIAKAETAKRDNGAPAAAGGATPPLPEISIGKVSVANGDFSFDDRSVEPGVHMAISQFGGTVSGLSSENLARADVQLKGLVDGAGPVSIEGKFDPLGAKKFVAVKVDFKNVDLLPISPYVGKFAGYALARGKLQVDTKFSLDGEKVDAANVVTLNQFTFGDATNSPDAVKLPVRLGVALLKDLDGKIVIDLPVQGSLGDPDFRIGKVVMRVIVNLLTKAAVSPFSLIGSMFGGGGEELAYQEFAPGAVELQSTEIPKLETMIKALTQRPGLSLGVEGGYDAAADLHALKSRKLADYVLRKIWEERRALNPNTPPPEQLVVTPAENAAMLKKLFDAKFPPGTTFGTPLPQPPAVTAPPAPPKGGFFDRLIAAITFRDMRARRAAQRENDRKMEEHKKAVAAAVSTGLPVDEMSGRLAETMEVATEDLRALGAKRAEQVRAYLVNTGHIAPDRIFLVQTNDAAGSKGPRVFLTLQ